MTSPSPIPRRKPVTIRIVFLLSLFLQLCETQSTAEGSGSKAISGRINHVGKKNLKNDTTKTLKIPEYIPVHLAQK